MYNCILFPVEPNLPKIDILLNKSLLILNIDKFLLIMLIDSLRLNMLNTESQGEISRLVIFSKTCIIEVITLDQTFGLTCLYPDVNVIDGEVDVMQDLQYKLL